MGIDCISCENAEHSTYKARIFTKDELAKIILIQSTARRLFARRLTERMRAE